ncbi:MAG: hypothetical protein M1115_03725 [Actinobacteria bacterium]|nr:hypothetical protein [Actinomycetota bacterium]
MVWLRAWMGLTAGLPRRPFVAATCPENRAAIIDYTTGSRLTKTFIDVIVQHSLEHYRVDAFASDLQSWSKTDFS